MHRWQELEALTRAPNSAARAELRLIAIAVLSGGAAAAAEVDKLPSELRVNATQLAAESLLWERFYPQAAALFARAVQQPGAPDWVAPRADLARRIRRIEDLKLDERDPGTVVRRFYVELLKEEGHIGARLGALCSVDAPALGEPEEASLVATRRSWRNQQLPYAVIRDAVLSLGVVAKEGDDHVGYRIRITKPFNAGVDTEFVVRENGGYRLLAVRNESVALGRHVLARIAAGDTDTARRWLDWIWEPYSHGDPVDHDLPAPFARVWTPNGGGSPEVMRIAAWMLLPGHSQPDNATALAGLRAARATPPAGVPLDAIELVLARTLVVLDQPVEALAVADSAKDSSSKLWFALRWSALGRLRRWSELRRLADAELQRRPDDPAALHALVAADEGDGRWDGFDRDIARIEQSGHAAGVDYNQRAWSSLFRRGADGQALDDAKRAVEMTQKRRPGVLHTLATIEAALGKNREAYATLLEAVEAGTGEPSPHDFYVLGLIAENLGLDEAALVEYRKVLALPKRPPEWLPMATEQLAEQRIRLLTDRE